MKVADVLVEGLVWWLKMAEGACWLVVEMDKQVDRYMRGPTRTGARAWEWDEARDGKLELTSADCLRRANRNRIELMRKWPSVIGRHVKTQAEIAEMLGAYQYPDNGGCLRSHSAERMNTRTMRAWDDYVREMQARQEDMESNTHGRDE